MRLHTSLLPLISAFLGQTFAQYGVPVDKPVITTGFQYNDFDYDLDRLLYSSAPKSWTITPWQNTSIIPQACHNSAYKNGVASVNIDVANIRFPDCSKDWTVCRTQGVGITWDDMAKSLATIPPGMRQYISNILLVPTIKNAGAVASEDGLITVREDSWTTRVLVHEFTHQMDAFALPALREGLGYSTSKDWKAAVAADTHVVTDYARTNNMENFAEIAAFAIMDGLVTGGIGRYIDNSQKALVINQLNKFNSVVRPLTRAGDCENKIQSTISVYKNGGNVVVGATPGAGVKREAVPAVQEQSSLRCVGLTV